MHVAPIAYRPEIDGLRRMCGIAMEARIELCTLRSSDATLKMNAVSQQAFATLYARLAEASRQRHPTWQYVSLLRIVSMATASSSRAIASHSRTRTA